MQKDIMKSNDKFKRHCQKINKQFFNGTSEKRNYIYLFEFIGFDCIYDEKEWNEIEFCNDDVRIIFHDELEKIEIVNYDYCPCFIDKKVCIAVQYYIEKKWS